MALNIKIQNFEGPFDLLLHLIKKSKMDIYDIKIYEITNNYLQYLNDMKEMDLEVTSEFIVIAATLIEIKSRMLLPQNSLGEDEVCLDDSDPRKELIQKLVEYKKFKQFSEYFKSRIDGSCEMFSKKPEIIEDIKKNCDINSLLKNITLLELYNVFHGLMDKYLAKNNSLNMIEREIPIDKYKIEDKIKSIIHTLDSNKSCKFTELVRSCKSKIEVVVTFLALLELIKMRIVTAAQFENFREIIIERTSINE